ncbi:alpha-L-arabinofuranosidase C-terminal domain-containing protein, partial [Balneolaceae bacterium ANBcel3]|nr:alpha-L-arabinofuranosidase C-terminal domain-containing protein [Balneolaceae bacterium ANBcel3]
LSGEGTYGIRQYDLEVKGGMGYDGYIVLAGNLEQGGVEVRLVLDDETILTETIPTLTSEYQSYPLRFEPDVSSKNVQIEIVSNGVGEFRIGTVSMMPENNIRGWRADVVDLVKQLDSPIYRWPGGNFVSGYDWRDGIGERDARPPRSNPAWSGIEPNDVGIHEFMDLMEILDSEAFIAVNTGLGTAQEAAEQVAYVNSPADTPLGRLRAENGHPEPYNVIWWAVGNEMYGDWQLGNMPVEEYVHKHNEVAQAMWDVDPDIKLVAVGDASGEFGAWSEAMMRYSAEYMDLISEHIYTRELVNVEDHTRQLVDQIRSRAESHRRYREIIPGLAEKDIRIAMDEWNYWYGQYIYGELGVQYHLKDALGIARGFHEFFRHSDLYFMANYAQTVNVIGAIKTTGTEAIFDATALPLLLYRQQFGTIPVHAESSYGSYDVSVAWTPEMDALTVAIVNPTPEKGTITLEVDGAALQNNARRWIISHPDPMAHNVPGEPQVLDIKEDTVSNTSVLEVPGYGVVLYRINAETL